MRSPFAARNYNMFMAYQHDHYSMGEIAEIWGMSKENARRILEREAHRRGVSLNLKTKRQSKVRANLQQGADQ